MQKWIKNRGLLSIVIVLALILGGCAQTGTVVEEAQKETIEIEENEYYYNTEDVALYIHTYNKLPENFITKSEANEMGWDSQAGNLWEVANAYVIGGDDFGNREKLLPIKEGRKYYEADVNYEGEYRGAERLVYSNDGLIFYTEDHYESFEQLY
ncbi:MAG: ribonuclease [Tissierellia bacterium]|nr:ribonuclease [Tissierellia bacterium]